MFITMKFKVFFDLILLQVRCLAIYGDRLRPGLLVKMIRGDIDLTTELVSLLDIPFTSSWAVSPKRLQL